MRIKTYRDRDLATALERARRELGPEALVLDRRQVPGKLGLPGIEITVAVDSAEPTRQGTGEELTRLAHEVRDLQERLAGGFVPPRNIAAHESAPRIVDEQAPRPPHLLSLVSQRLVRAGLSADLATRFETIASRDLGSRHDLAELARATQRGIAGLLPLKPLGDRWSTILMVGPLGSGTSGAAAALASRCVERCSDSVVWIRQAGGNGDSDRRDPSVSDRIRTRVTRFDEPERLARLIADCGRDSRVVVDSGGVETGDDDALASMTRLRELVPASRVVLRLPADLTRGRATDLLHRFAPLEPSCSVVSRVDESPRFGELITALSASNVPLGFTTEGHRSRTSLKPATPARMARLLIGEVHQHGASQ